MSFKFKIIIGPIIIQCVFLLVLYFISTNSLEKSSQIALDKRATTTANLFTSMAKDSVLSYDLATLETYADEVIKQPDITYIKIYDGNNALIVSKGSEQSLAHIFNEDKSVSNITDDIYDIVSYIKVSNEIYGRIEFGINIDFIKEIESTAHKKLLPIALLAIFLTTLFTYWLSQYLTKKLLLLMNGATELSSGNLNYRINIDSHDELGKTAISFNEMANKLKELYSSLEKEININKAMFSTSPSGIITINSQGEILNINSATEALFGYSEEQCQGKNINIFFIDAQSKHRNLDISDALINGKPSLIGSSHEVMAFRKNGDTLPIQISIGEMETDGQKTFVGIINDISELKKIHDELLDHKNNLELTVRNRTEQLVLSRNAAEAGIKSKSAFLANMSHEIRTPMNSIIGFSEILLLNEPLSPNAKKHIETILISAKSLLNIINDILDISKLDSGKFSLETVCFNLGNLIYQTLQSIEHLAFQKDLELKLEINKKLPMHFLGDPTRLRQVILNLVGNSIKFTNKGIIILKIFPSQNKDNSIHFSISDTGIGMTEEQTLKVFDSFVQADDSTTRRFGGTGLGTTISKQIVSLMGGEIWAESELGKGSTFHFTAKLIATEGNDDCLYNENNSMLDEFQSPRLFNILLAEDIQTNADLATLRLSQVGHKVTWAKNGKEVLDKLYKDDYDLILMDVMMPEMDGLKATEIIRSDNNKKIADITIIALTASITQEDHNNCREAGMNAIEGKPIDFVSLFHTMETLVPENLGIYSDINQIEIWDDEHTDIDLSSMMHIADVEKALNIWRSEKAYIGALKRFAEERKNDANTILDELQKNPDDVGPARTIAHALKGLSGNLCLYIVEENIINIDSDLKRNDREAALTRIGALNAALKITSDTVKHLPTIAIDALLETDVPITLDKDKLTSTLNDVYSSIASLNPDEIEPFIVQLSKLIGASNIFNLQNEINNFDFDKAQEECFSIAEKYQININS